MDGPPNIPYEIIYDELYTAQAKLIEQDQRILDEKLRDLEFVIARVPTLFPHAGDTSIRRAIYDGKPRLRIWFSFDGARITMRSIEQYGINEI
jgi:hypothetical protein